MKYDTTPPKQPVEILIAEDSPTQAEKLRYLLEQHQYSVTAAKNGKEALSLLEKYRQALVITDIVMPEMNGFELCRQIKTDERTCDIPVILLTSLSDPEDVLEGLACGADSFITKPYSEDYLLMNVQQILANSELRKGERVRIGVEIFIGGHKRFVTADHQQMLTMLISTYEAAVRRNSELLETQDELSTLNMRLEDLVEERTAALQEEIIIREKAEERERLARNVLELLNRPAGVTETISDILHLVKTAMDIEAVAIRLKEGDDFPYYVTNGFPEDFTRSEWFLCARNEVGEIVRDESGDPVLECICGRVLRGRIDRALPFFTENGCFWRNSISQFLAITPEESGREPIRNRCSEQGYESVAFIPLRTGDDIIGLIQFNDHRPDRFTPEMIRFLEGMGASIGIALDRKQAEERIKDMARFPSENPDPILRISHKGILLYINEAGERLLPDWHLQVGQPVLPALRDICLKVTDSESSQVLDIEHEKRLYSFFVSSGFDSAYVYAYGRDITDRKNLEEQLRQAQKLEAVGQLAGGVAHDFNNMLGVIIGYGGELLDKLPKDDPMWEDVKEIVDAGRRSADLTRQLLAFSRKQILQVEVVDLNNIVKNLEKMLRRLIGENIGMTTLLAKGLTHVKIDPGQMEQVFMNLAVNARDAMRDGGELTIETMNVELDETYSEQHAGVLPGRYVGLIISDTGCGMDSTTKERIFEPFFTTKGVGAGTGLGLSTVHGIIKQSGGDIWVYSEPGKGTTFKIYLPEVLEEQTLTKEKTKEEGIHFGGVTILLVEDEPALRGSIERMLMRLKCQVKTVANGDDALFMFEQEGLRPHILITDVVMPGMNGMILAEKLRKIQPNLKVLYMSGYTDNAITHHGILDSGLNFIAKPFGLNDLTEKVERLLRDYD